MDKCKEPTVKQKQIRRVLTYMESHGSITQREASMFLSVERLASRMTDIKRMGYPIVSKWERNHNQFGEPCRYKRYSMGSGADG